MVNNCTWFLRVLTILTNHYSEKVCVRLPVNKKINVVFEDKQKDKSRPSIDVIRHIITRREACAHISCSKDSNKDDNNNNKDHNTSKTMYFRGTRDPTRRRWKSDGPVGISHNVKVNLRKLPSSKSSSSEEKENGGGEGNSSNSSPEEGPSNSNESGRRPQGESSLSSSTADGPMPLSSSTDGPVPVSNQEKLELQTVIRDTFPSYYYPAASAGGTDVAAGPQNTHHDIATHAGRDVEVPRRRSRKKMSTSFRKALHGQQSQSNEEDENKSTEGGDEASSSNFSTDAEQDEVDDSSQGSYDQNGVPVFKEPIDYAAGIALRAAIIQPLLKEVPEELRPELPHLVSLHFLGNCIYIYGGATGVLQVKVEFVTRYDSASIASWWGLDKVLSYSSLEWSEWWTQKCCQPDPGCEMIKLVLLTGEILGVAYLERNTAIDHHNTATGKHEKIDISLVRGIRVAPPFNMEVKRRINVPSDSQSPEDEPVAFRGIASALLSHMICASLRYGSLCIGVHSEKNEMAEHFYQRHFGAPLRISDRDGRQFFLMAPEAKWKFLRGIYRRQVMMWRTQRGEEGKKLTTPPPPSSSLSTSTSTGRSRRRKKSPPPS
jgi:hypothetical protein